MSKRVLFVTLMTLLVAGCQSTTPPPAVVGFQAASTGKTFAQNFARAYFSESPDGDRDVVLIDDGYPEADSHSPGPIKPVAAIPLRQVMHFKVLWDPPHGTQADAPSTTNAIIDWTVRTTDRSGNADVLNYRGAGYVETSGGGGRLWLNIKSGTIESTRHTGNLIDPLGRCGVNGSFYAARNDPLVTTTIADMRQNSADPVPASSQIGPPTRMPSP